MTDTDEQAIEAAMDAVAAAIRRAASPPPAPPSRTEAIEMHRAALDAWIENYRTWFEAHQARAVKAS